MFLKKITNTIKMDTPQIPEKIKKNQLSVFFKSSWGIFYLIFLHRQVWKLFENGFVFLKLCFREKRDQWPKGFQCGPMEGKER